LDSILSQKYGSWEALIIDDCSTDQSCVVIQDYVVRDPRFRLFHNNLDSKGANSCRNYGLRNSKGEYVIFLDSDDVLDSEFLSNRYNILCKGEKLDFIVNNGGEYINGRKLASPLWEVPVNVNHLNCFLKHEIPWNITGPTWSKDFLVLNKVEFDVNLKRLQDIDFHIRILLVKDVKFKIYNGPIYYYYRIDEARITSSEFVKLNDLVDSVLKLYSKYFIDASISEYHAKNIFFNGTIVCVMITIQYQFHRKNIDAIQRNQLFEKLSIFKKIFILNLFEKGLRFGLDRIKGYNYIFKYLATRLQ
jgi:glycosyltransferase involved in cell wall biosynthesis